MATRTRHPAPHRPKGHRVLDPSGATPPWHGWLAADDSTAATNAKRTTSWPSPASPAPQFATTDRPNEMTSQRPERCRTAEPAVPLGAACAPGAGPSASQDQARKNVSRRVRNSKIRTRSAVTDTTDLPSTVSRRVLLSEPSSAPGTANTSCSRCATAPISADHVSVVTANRQAATLRRIAVTGSENRIPSATAAARRDRRGSKNRPLPLGPAARAISSTRRHTPRRMTRDTSAHGTPTLTPGDEPRARCGTAPAEGRGWRTGHSKPFGRSLDVKTGTIPRFMLWSRSTSKRGMVPTFIGSRR